MKEYLKILNSGDKVVMDATNPTEARRAEFYEEALKRNLKVAVVWFIRNGRPRNALRKKAIDESAYGRYSNRFEIPNDIKEVPVYRVY